jgi:hypothetical protein
MSLLASGALPHTLTCQYFGFSVFQFFLIKTRTSSDLSGSARSAAAKLRFDPECYTWFTYITDYGRESRVVYNRNELCLA